MRSRLLTSSAAAAAAVFAFGAAPALASTHGCHSGGGGTGTSATSIYSEQSSIPTSGSCNKDKSGQIVQYVAPPTVAVKALSHLNTSKANRALLERLATSTEFGASAPLPMSPAAEHVKSPSTLGAAFDLGSGPMTLFALLLAAAVGVAVGGGLRQRRR